jgi:hypothetical protein
VIVMSISEKLENSESFGEIFELVKESVRKTLERGRAGLMLGLADLGINRGWFIGGYHPLGSNIIVLNKTPLKIVADQKPELLNCYVFQTLLHEYLHSLGYWDEKSTRYLTYEICREILGKNHPTTQLTKNFTKFFPDLHQYNIPPGGDFEYVLDFDKSNVTYIG